jgi:hypothetical protein
MPELKQFELLDELRPNETAQAVLLQWNGQRYERTRKVVELADFVGQHGHIGDRGYAFHSPESGRWEVAFGLNEESMMRVVA